MEMMLCYVNRGKPEEKSQFSMEHCATLEDHKREGEAG